MKIVCKSFADFKTCLQNLPLGSFVYERVIRVSKDEIEVSEGALEVTFYGGAIIQREDGSQYVLEVTKNCGFDYTSSDPGSEGSDEVERLSGILELLAEKNSWQIFPGVIEI